LLFGELGAFDARVQGRICAVTDVLTPEQRSRNMAAIRGKNTGPEMKVRRALHAMGYRYRLHGPGLAGKPDLVFPRFNTVVFVHGCFWHMHRCPYGRCAPSSNAAFWETKRLGNNERDRRNRRALKADGWKVFTIWECETRDATTFQKRLAALQELLR
jgi:DNA mismatch endonuclease, patch repair protein